jgi:hypothetical protein
MRGQAAREQLTKTGRLRLSRQLLQLDGQSAASGSAPGTPGAPSVACSISSALMDKRKTHDS